MIKTDMKEQLKQLVYTQAEHQELLQNEAYKSRLDYELEEFDKYELNSNVLLYAKISNACDALDIPKLPIYFYVGASLVYFILGISDVDPIEHNIPFLDALNLMITGFELPENKTSELLNTLSKAEGLFINQLVQEVDKESDAANSGNLIEHNGKANKKLNRYSFRNSVSERAFLMDEVYYEIQELTEGEKPNNHITSLSFEKSDKLSLLYKLTNSGVKSTMRDYKDEKVYSFLKTERLNSILSYVNKNRWIKQWMNYFPLSNLNELSAAVAMGNLKDRNEVYDYIDSYYFFQKGTFPIEVDTRILIILSKGNGSLLYQEQFMEMAMLLLGMDYSNAQFRIHQMQLKYNDVKTQNPDNIQNAKEEFIAQIKSDLKSNGDIEYLHGLWLLMLESMHDSVSQIKAFQDAQILYQLAFYNFYFLDVFNECRIEIHPKRKTAVSSWWFFRRHTFLCLLF